MTVESGRERERERMRGSEGRSERERGGEEEEEVGERSGGVHAKSAEPRASGVVAIRPVAG